jgi:branched-chain amino acid transport system permease protein
MYGAGAYAAGLFAIHVWADPVAGLLVGACAGAALAAASGLILMRTHGLTLIMLTIAIAQICAEIANRFRDVTGGADGLRGIRMQPVLGLWEFDFIGITGYWYACAAAAVVLALLVIITRSAFGLSLRGIHESPERMEAIGASVYWRRMLAYTLGGTIAGVAGALTAQITQLVSLETFSFALSAEALIMLILGGTGRIYGAVIGTVIFMAVHHTAAANDPFNWLFVIGAMVLAVVFFLPSGLIALPKALTSLTKGGRNV